MKTLYFLTAALLPLSLHAGITPGSTNIGAVWFVGDSITQSNADGDSSGSPRKSLYNLLVANNYTFSYTGHRTDNVDGLPATGGTAATNLYQYHSGISGSLIGSDISPRVGMTQNLPSQWATGRLATIKPNVVLIMLGTNDVTLDIDRPNAPGRLTTYLNTLYSQSGVGNPTVLVASIPPNRTSTAGPDKRVWVNEFNAAVPGIVRTQRALGRDVHFVDQFTPLENGFPTMMQADNLHPNAAGNNSLARQWFNKIEELVTRITATGVAVSAETDNSVAGGSPAASTYSPEIVANDLINGSQPSLLSAAWDKTPGFSSDPVNDGDGHPVGSGAGTFLPATYGTGSKMPFTYTALLNTSVNTRGYTITSIRSFAGWNQNGAALANQKYELFVSKVGNPNYESLGTYEYSPFSNSSTQEAGATRMVLTPEDGVIVSGVDAVRFVVMSHGFNSADSASSTLDGSIFQEFDVIGLPAGQGFVGWAVDANIPALENYDATDHDGIGALMEYALGYFPLVRETLPALNAGASPFRITWPKGVMASTDPEITYRAKVSTNLTNWANPDAGEVSETAGALSLDLNHSGPHRFGRLEVTRTAP